jgi:TonB family protein
MRKLILIVTTTILTTAAFAQNDTNSIVKIVWTPHSNLDAVFAVCDKMPEYPGGMEDLYFYLNTHIHYPGFARENNIEGRVLVKFVVNKSGKVSDAVVLKGINKGCDKEALRVVSGMPDWKPGTKDGEPVNGYFTLPVNFVLTPYVKTDD